MNLLKYHKNRREKIIPTIPTDVSLLQTRLCTQLFIEKKGGKFHKFVQKQKYACTHCADRVEGRETDNNRW